MEEINCQILKILCDIQHINSIKILKIWFNLIYLNLFNLMWYSIYRHLALSKMGGYWLIVIFNKVTLVILINQKYHLLYMWFNFKRGNTLLVEHPLSNVNWQHRLKQIEVIKINITIVYQHYHALDKYPKFHYCLTYD